MFSFFAHLFAPSNPLWFYYPLAIVIGVVYKTTQFDAPAAIFRGVLHFLFSVTLFMIGLAVVLYGVAQWL
jgi:predicted phage tail protein